MNTSRKLYSLSSRWLKIMVLMGVFFNSGIALAQSNRVVVIPISGDDLKPLKNIITVAKANGDFDNPTDAISSIPTSGIDMPSETNPYLIVLAPGVYEVSEPMVMKPWVNISGSGQKSTTIRGQVGTAAEATSPIIRVVGNSSLTDLTIINWGKPGFAWSLGIYNQGGSALIERVTIDVSGGSNGNYGVYVLNSSTVMNHVTTRVFDANSIGIFINGSRSAPLIQNSNLAGESAGLRIDASSTAARIVYSRIIGGVTDLSAATQCLGNFSGVLAPVNC